MSSIKKSERIIIVDFGSQVTKLIARRIREFKVFSEILTLNEFKNIKDFKHIKGIILSGGPSSVTKRKYFKIPNQTFSKKIPILGIRYGLQLIAKSLGGQVKTSLKKREFGKALLIKKNKSLLTKNFFKNKKNSVWMSHQDAVVKLPKNFKKVASTKDSTFTIIENKKKKIYGVQFHPEVTHTTNGEVIIKNFIFNICQAKKKWKVSYEKQNIIKEIKKVVKKDKVICALSGGVDSSVAALLIHKAIRKNLVCIMVDTGLMRKNEFIETYKVFKKKYKLNVRIIKAGNLFFNKLKD